ncbi:MAG: sugar phosphate isomerase/epimerase family protein [Planctomycetota bacterium]
MKRRIAAFIDGLRQPWAESLSTAQRIGLRGVQFTPTGPLAPKALDAAARRQVRSDLAANSLTLTALCGDLGGHGFSRSDEHGWRLDATKELLDLTVDLGATVISAHVGVIPATAQHPRWATLAKALALVGHEAAQRGLRYAIETGPETSAVLRSFLDTVGSPGLAVNFDPANLAMVHGEDAVTAWTVLRPWTVHVHAKDGVRHKPCNVEEVYAAFADGGFPALEARTGSLFAETPLGAGQVDWPRLLRAIEASGYHAWLTIERETGADPAHDIATAKTYLEKLP